MTARASRTRTLIQVGGLFEKAGLLDAFEIGLGDDLQRDEHTFEPAAAVLGALLDLKGQLQADRDGGLKYVWKLKGKKALME